MPDVITRNERLHPEVRALLEMMDAQGAPPLETQDPIEARNAIPVRIYAAESGGLRPALIYFHGGGFVFGNLDTHDSVCRAFAIESGAVVISVDYRLAPENKFPAAVDDSYAATQWVAANAGRLGIDASRIAVGGDSAGGNLATVVAMRCRDAGGPALALQLLIYPVTDVSSFETASHRELAEGYFLTRAAMEWFTGHYLASPDQVRHPEASPLLAKDLSGLPPAVVITAEFDPLRDEGEAYAKRLQQSGVSVTIKRYPGMIHGFISMHGVISGGREAIHETSRFLSH